MENIILEKVKKKETIWRVSLNIMNIKCTFIFLFYLMIRLKKKKKTNKRMASRECYELLIDKVLELFYCYEFESNFCIINCTQ